MLPNRPGTWFTFTPDGRELLLANLGGVRPCRWVAADDAVRRYRAADWPQRGMLIGPPAFAPDGRHLAAALYDGTVRVWDTARWRERAALDWKLRSPAGAVEFTPDGLLGVVAYNRQIVVWDFAA